MARKRGTARRRSNFVALPIDHQLALLTLGDETVIANAVTTLGVTKIWAISADLTWSMSLHTPGEGPIQVGLAQGDLTTTEIAESIQASPVSKSDIIAIERARRPVRRTGVFSGAAAAESLNDGRKIRTKLRFTVDTGLEVSMWAMNKGTALTTGTLISVQGMLYANWA